jgi:hypothetical protein
MKPLLWLLLLVVTGPISCSDTGSQPIDSHGVVHGDLIVKFDIIDPVGQSKRAFRTSEAVNFIFLVINESDQPQTWNAAMGYPPARFMATTSDSIIGDSFYGLAFIATPISGTVAPGDSMKSIWRANGKFGPLLAGDYTAASMPMIHFPDHTLSKLSIDFSLVP